MLPKGRSSVREIAAKGEGASRFNPAAAISRFDPAIQSSCCSIIFNPPAAIVLNSVYDPATIVDSILLL